MAKEKWAPKAGPDAKEDNIEKADHFATRTRANDFVRLMRSLPDLDPILKRMGRGITALQELLSDSHLESVWTVRCAAASGAEWFIAPAENGGAREQEAADAFAAELKDMDVPRIIEEMMDAVAYGFSPLEILWTPKGGRWGLQNIVGKPPQWFEFSQENRLLFKTGALGTEELPENRFLLVQHRPSYANPYGVKVFSKCFWPVTFKKNGFKWWTVFTEKFGGAFIFGKYPLNATEQLKEEFLGSLEKLAADAVAIVPEGAEVTITTAADKAGSSSVHERYIQMANYEISKAVLGETLTTEVGDTGSYAAAQTHNEVRKDIAAADRRRISSAFNWLASIHTAYNFGADVMPPRFEFVKDEDLQVERADRDIKLYQVGWRPTKEYVMRQYGLQEEDFDMQETSGGMFSDFDRAAPKETHFNSCSCGCENVNNKPSLPARRSLFDKIAMLFASREEKANAKAASRMAEFAGTQLEKGQREIDKTIELISDALGKAGSYEEASAAIAEVMKNRDCSNFARCIEEVRYAAQVLGERNG